MVRGVDKMKKKGSSLMITMVLLLSLIIIGLAVSSAIIKSIVSILI